MLGENSTVTSSSGREHEDETELQPALSDEIVASAIETQARPGNLPSIFRDQ
jgi:hypothetical protein